MEQTGTATSSAPSWLAPLVTVSDGAVIVAVVATRNGSSMASD
jgi:hypothetical protein